MRSDRNQPVDMTTVKTPGVDATAETPLDASFAEVLALIQDARQRTWQAVNTEMIDLYWRLGEYIHHKIEAVGWAKGTVVQLAAYIARRQPGVQGYSPQNLWRMRQFYQLYRDDTKLSPLVRLLPWTHNMVIVSQCKTAEEREFYLRMAGRERWKKRELERQLASGLFQRAVLNPPSQEGPIYVIPARSENCPLETSTNSQKFGHIRRPRARFGQGDPPIRHPRESGDPGILL